MRSTFHGLEVSKRGLFAQQSALNTTGHNISNANTEGYTRQRANMKATAGVPYVGLSASREPGLLGTGVTVTDLQRIRDEFLDVQYRNENKRNGYWEERVDAIKKIEGIMTEPSETGLQKVMDQMWQAWQDLSKDPTSPSARAVVRERANAVADTFAGLYGHLQEVQRDFDNVISVKALEVNSLGQQIADLNKQIGDVVPHGYQPNDLYDQRDVLIDRISKLTEVKVTASESGMVNVTIEGKELVNGRTSVQMAVTKDDNTGFNKVTLGGEDFVPKQGSFAATFESRDVLVPNMLKRLDVLAVNLTKEINDLHKTGLSLTDIKNGGAPSGIPFFVDTEKGANTYPTSAGKIVLNPAILASLDAIAAAQPEASGTASVGNNNNALAIASIKFKVIQKGTGPLDFSESSTVDEYYRYTISEYGVFGQEAKRNAQNSEATLGMVENQRQSVSGVSIDDEMAEMVKYQHAYNASARAMTSVDEILDKIINGMGRVGL